MQTGTTIPKWSWSAPVLVLYIPLVALGLETVESCVISSSHCQIPTACMQPRGGRPLSFRD